MKHLHSRLMANCCKGKIALTINVSTWNMAQKYKQYMRKLCWWLFWWLYVVGLNTLSSNMDNYWADKQNMDMNFKNIICKLLYTAGESKEVVAICRYWLQHRYLGSSEIYKFTYVNTYTVFNQQLKYSNYQHRAVECISIVFLSNKQVLKQFPKMLLSSCNIRYISKSGFHILCFFFFLRTDQKEALCQ